MRSDLKLMKLVLSIMCYRLLEQPDGKRSPREVDMWKEHPGKYKDWHVCTVTNIGMVYKETHGYFEGFVFTHDIRQWMFFSGFCVPAPLVARNQLRSQEMTYSEAKSMFYYLVKIKKHLKIRGLINWTQKVYEKLELQPVILNPFGSVNIPREKNTLH